jgi:hypothetical protein
LDAYAHGQMPALLPGAARLSRIEVDHEQRRLHRVAVTERQGDPMQANKQFTDDTTD